MALKIQEKKTENEKLIRNNNFSDEFELSTSPNTYRENYINKHSPTDKHKNGKNIYCGNCGNLGHTYKRCRYPITSCGVILYKYNPDYKKEMNNKYLYLLIQRKDTIGYVNF